PAVAVHLYRGQGLVGRTRPVIDNQGDLAPRRLLDLRRGGGRDVSTRPDQGEWSPRVKQRIGNRFVPRYVEGECTVPAKDISNACGEPRGKPFFGAAFTDDPDRSRPAPPRDPPGQRTHRRRPVQGVARRRQGEDELGPQFFKSFDGRGNECVARDGIGGVGG